jgi:hypothetical protein
MKKKVFLISVTVIFLSLVSLSTVEGKGNPWDAVWNAINDLYSRIDAIEPQEEYIKYIRFYDPSEHIVDTETLMIATYTITPNNPTNNAILSYHFYFESKGPWTIIDFTILDEHGGHSSTGRDTGSSGSYKWSNVYRVDYMESLPKPNSSVYTVKVTILSGSGPVYIRNLNFMVEYMDGLPPNN